VICADDEDRHEHLDAQRVVSPHGLQYQPEGGKTR
jgi:hypothetical protein